MRSSKGSLPVYLQIAETLVRDITAGRLIDGEKLPPEREMASTLGIAVGTLRKTLAELHNRGLLKRIQGSGNYICAITDPKSVYSMFRLELITGGGFPTADVLSVSRQTKPHDIPSFGSSEEGHRIRRLRRIGGKAAAIEEIWLDGSYIEQVAAEELSESLYLYYRTRLGLWIAKAEDHIDLGHVPDWSPDAFGPRRGDAVPHVLRISYSHDGATAEISHTWYDQSVARYVNRLR